MVFKEALEQVKENLSTEEREIAAVDLENMTEGTKEHLEMAKQVLLAKEFEEDRPYLDVGKNDFVDSKDQDESSIGKGHTTCDLDSVVGYLKDLRTIKSHVNIEINPSAMTNLQDSVHLQCSGKSLHKITNCRLLTFGTVIKYSVYLLAPEIESKTNIMSDAILRSLTDEALLPAVKYIVHPNQRTAFPERFQEIQAKCRARYVQGRRTYIDYGREQHMDFCVAKEFVQDVFKEFKKNLKFHINHDHPHLSQLRGYKFLVSATNENSKILANDIGDLLTKVRRR